MSWDTRFYLIRLAQARPHFVPAIELMDTLHPTVIRGNISEIKTLASGSGTTKGVDADVSDKVTDENLDDTISKLKSFSKATGSIIAVTGAIDLVCDSEKCYPFDGRNGQDCKRIYGFTADGNEPQLMRQAASSEKRP